MYNSLKYISDYSLNCNECIIEPTVCLLLHSNKNLFYNSNIGLWSFEFVEQVNTVWLLTVSKEKIGKNQA